MRSWDCEGSRPLNVKPRRDWPRLCMVVLICIISCGSGALVHAAWAGGDSREFLPFEVAIEILEHPGDYPVDMVRSATGRFQILSTRGITALKTLQGYGGLNHAITRKHAANHLEWIRRATKE